MAVRFLRKNPVSRKKRRTSFPVRFRLSFNAAAPFALFRCTNSEPQFSIADAQQVFPLPEIALEAHAPRDFEGRDHAPLDLLSALSSTFAS